MVGDPWDEYVRDRLPRDWAYPFGQQRVAEALREAGATVGSLGLHSPKLPPDPGPLPVFDVWWLSDARPGYLRPGGTGRSRLMMRWNAVPVADLSEVRRQLDVGVLRRGCEWAAAALTRGNAWSATEHRFWVTFLDGELRVSER